LGGRINLSPVFCVRSYLTLTIIPYIVNVIFDNFISFDTKEFEKVNLML